MFDNYSVALINNVVQSEALTLFKSLIRRKNLANFSIINLTVESLLIGFRLEKLIIFCN